LGIAQELLKKEIHKKDVQLKPKGGSQRQTIDPHIDPIEVHLIRLLLEYPQKTTYVENEKVLDFFLHPELKNLGEKIVEAYKLLGFVDINVILSADDDRSLREKIYKLSIEAPPTDDTMVEKNFTDTIRRIKEKWYKDQHRQLKLKLARAQESGNEEILSSLLHEKKELITKERELR
jgi:DNA primase